MAEVVLNENRDTDLVVDLRRNARYCPLDTRIPNLMTEAADEIERMRRNLNSVANHPDVPRLIREAIKNELDCHQQLSQEKP